MNLYSASRLARASTLAFVVTLLAVSCTLGPDFVPPETTTTARWKSGDEAVESAYALPERWWTLFADDELDRLVEIALFQNQDLSAALARVEQARAFAGIARAAQSPTVYASPSASRERYSANRAAPPGSNSVGYTENSFSLPLDVAYEVDLWGRVRRAREAADAAAVASEFDFDALTLAISSQVARTYFALRTALREEDVLRAAADLRRRVLDIVAGRARAGVGTDLDTSRTRAELATVETDLRRVTRGRVALGNALAVLCGSTPADFVVLPDIELESLPDVPPGLPSELLRRRPDVAAAIERLHEASARIGMTEAEAYPRLSLTGSIGFVSSDLSQLLDASSQAWSLGGAIAAPIYAGGEFDERNRAARAFYDERAADYRATVLDAFREVEDALSALGILHGEMEFQAEARDAARETLDLANARYVQGLTSFLDVVDAARTELDARRALVRLQGVRAESTVLLVQALGGGWEATSALAAANR